MRKGKGDNMICERCGKYWTPPVGWYLTHSRTEDICGPCLKEWKTIVHDIVIDLRKALNTSNDDIRAEVAKQVDRLYELITQ